ncbi:LacI family DNA-binding transcriptional regulator [Arthrobacter sp. CJ23]|uniref:LacI family DNA-binding transcriptional regulator n=1 Tax=Arthrobacter sp. CJ23 TaxID=2972479 RepID=UPI00215BC547|nr:LacI family DNA-binding transcriptional regulator [Arthrobacter sp. CJ23]UVJ40060.1 LacI family transcriptional regulator [Arthrobacter sp. CJ23]
MVHNTRKAASLMDVARLAGVSRSTAARVLGGYGSVNGELASMVEAAAETLGYRGNALARSVSSGRSNTIGVVVSDIENPFFARAVQGMTAAAKRGGYDVILASTAENAEAERDAVQVFLDKRVDGLIIAASSRTNTSHLLDVVKMGRPLVLLDRRPDGVDADWVGTDSYDEARHMVRHLVEHGHRSIAFIAGTTKTPDQLEAGHPLPISTIADRVRAIRETAREAGIAYEFLPGAMTPAEAQSVVREMLSRAEPPTALIASYNRLALPAFQAIRAAGLRIPEDMSFVSMDDAEWMTVSSPGVTAMALPAYELGERAAEILIARANGAGPESTSHLLPSVFMDRESVARLNAPVGSSKA